MEPSLPGELERVIRAAHPSEVYEDFQLQPGSALPVEKILADLRRVPGVLIDHEAPQHSAVRSHSVYIGRGGAPGWMTFNRDYSGLERVAYLRNAARGPIYWTLMLSRVGRYWTGNWNEFVLREEDVLVDIPETPRDADWRRIIGAVSAVLKSARLQPIESSVLALPVPWLKTSKKEMLLGQGRSPWPSVFDCFFDDLS